MKMDVRLVILWVVVSLWCCCTAQESDCEISFREEPLSEVPCEPYRHGLRVDCLAEGVDEVDKRFDIVWFRRTFNNQQSEMLTTDRGPEPMRIINIKTIFQNFQLNGVFMRRVGTQLRITELDEQQHTGLYWCEIQPRSESSVLSNTPSNILTLRNRATYESLRECNNTESFIMDDIRRCIFPATPPTMTPDPQLLGTTLAVDTTIVPTINTDTMNTQDTSESTNTQLTTMSVEESSTSGNQLVALYSVLAVIVVFCAVIITLTVTIVILYRRRYGRLNFKKKTPGPNTGNPYDGMSFGDQERERRSVSCHSNITGRSDSRLASSTQTNSPVGEEPYSKLIHTPHTKQPMVPPQPGDYSKLDNSGKVPPRPPKPPSMKSNSTVPPNRESQIYSDLTDKDLERGLRSKSVENPSIYRTLEHQRGSYEYDYARPHLETNSTTTKSLFDDPEYSPLKGAKKEKVDVVDPRYIGDYERSPTYSLPTVQVKASEVDPKYQGDYEWDPTYVPKPPPRRSSFSSEANQRIPTPHEVLQRRKSIDADLIHKYSGDYERSPNYVPPPVRNGSMGNGIPGMDRKYAGDYERDPTYMASQLKKGRGNQQGGSHTLEALVPPHIPHEYTALEEVRKDPPQHYARLNSEPPDIQY